MEVKPIVSVNGRYSFYDKKREQGESPKKDDKGKKVNRKTPSETLRQFNTEGKGLYIDTRC